MPTLRLTSLLCLLLAVVWTSAACRSARRKVDGDIVHKIQFDGLGPPIVRPFSKAQLRSAMSQKQSGIGVRTPGLTWVARTAVLDHGELDTDTYRIETWLAHHGYFDARVEGWRIIRKRPQKTDGDGSIRKAGVVDIVGEVSFGEPSLIRSFDVEWKDDKAGRFTRSAQEAVLKRTAFIEEGEPFNLDYVDYAVADLVRRLRQDGYIFADAKARIDAYPATREVDVVIEATTGPPTTMGELRFVGNERVPPEIIDDVIDLEPGTPLKSDDMRDAQQDLIATSVFSIVRVEPDTEDLDIEADVDEDGKLLVPVKISTTEGRFGTARLGFGTVYDGTTITPRLSGSITNNNIDRRLSTIESSANIGWGVPLQGGVDASRILYGASVGFTKPRVFSRIDAVGEPDTWREQWDFNASASYQRDLLAGQLLYSRLRGSVGLIHHFTDHVFVSFGPAAELVRLGPGNPFSSSNDASLSETDKLLVAATYGGNPGSVRNPFALLVGEGRLTIDWRKGEPLDPRGGYFYEVSLRQAVPSGPDDFKFTDIYGEARFYRSLLRKRRGDVPYTLALRLKGRYIPGPADTFQDAVPYSERAFLGGSFGMRSFRINQVGPYDCVCLAEEEPIVEGPFWPFTKQTGGTRLEPNPTFLPRGGRISGLVSGEVRRRWPSGRGIALFGDVGILARSKEELYPRYLPHSLRWGIGTGFRQDTPVGPIRIDLAFRPRYPEDGAPQRADMVTTAGSPADDAYYQGQYYGCDEIPDSRLPTRATGITAFGWEPPIIVNLAIAIGEAL